MSGSLPPAWAGTLFRLGLFAYPATFRRQWGEGMEEAFHDAWAEARASGGIPAALFTVRTTLNLIRTGLGERLTPSPDPDGRRSRYNEASTMDHLRQDLRYAVRALLRRPGFTVVAVVTLALGVGANTAIFSVIDGVLLTPLPYPRAERLVTVWTAYEAGPDAKGSMSKPDMDDIAATGAFESLVGWSEADVALTGMGEAEVIDGARVTGGLLEVFGLRPYLGRDLRPVYVRSAPAAPPIVPAVRRQVAALDADLPLREVATMEDVVRRELASGRFYLTLVALFAGLALVLAAVGLYGVVSYLVSRRTREIGVRMAMGAGRHSIASLVLRQGMRPAAVGLAAGLLVAYLGSRVLESLLYQVDPTDPAIFAGVAVLLASVVMMATLLPARSATRVDPVEALRAE